MPTFLTTPKMNPALAARIEARVAGKSAIERARQKAARADRDAIPLLGSSSRMVAAARVVAVAAVVGLVAFVLVGRKKAKDELESERAAILAAVGAAGADVTADDLGTVARAEKWLAKLAKAYEGDYVAPELRSTAARGATFARTMVYLRAPIGEVGSARAVAESSASSYKDAFVLCLVAPPAQRTEKAFLPLVHEARGGGNAFEDRTANVRRLLDAQVGLPVLAPEWAQRVKEAEDHRDLARLHRELDTAPLNRAKAAARAELLLAVLDEANDPGGPTELDGEHAHWVRVFLVDMRRGTELLRQRKHVDPSWISEAKRSSYAQALDGCGLAFDLHQGE